MIDVEGLTKSYGPRVVVDDINFHVEKGEIVGFLGPNGAGKTTTMRMLAGYLPPTEGRASIAGFDTFSHSLDARRRIGYLPETVPLYPEMAVADYLDFMAALRHVTNRKAAVQHAERGLSEQVSFRAGDVRQLPFDDNAFDWAWSSNCVGYAPLEPLPLLKELARVVRPGGSVAILAWSSETLLPGYPALEARLDATSAGIAPFVKGKQPALHFMRALGWFREAGLKESVAQTFVGDAYAPLSDDLRQALISLFEMRWPGAESELSPEDRAEYRRLCRPESPEFIVNHPDYCAFFTCTMFRGQVA